MKLDAIKKKITVNFTVSAFLVIANCSVVFFYNSEKNYYEQLIEKIKKDTKDTNDKVSEIELKAEELKKYRELYSKISATRRIKKEPNQTELNQKLEELTKKYSINNQKLVLSTSEVITDGILKRDVIGVIITECTLTYSSFNDTSAVDFFEEFLDSLYDYPIIKSISITKSKDYSNEDLIAISKGTEKGTVSTEAKIIWYTLKGIDKKVEAIQPVNK